MYIWGSHTGIYFPSRGFWTPNPSKVGVYNCAYWALLQTYFILQTFMYTLSPLSKLETPNYILNPSLKIGSILLQNLVLLALRSAQSGSSSISNCH